MHTIIFITNKTKIYFDADASSKCVAIWGQITVTKFEYI